MHCQYHFLCIACTPSQCEPGLWCYQGRRDRSDPAVGSGIRRTGRAGQCGSVRPWTPEYREKVMSAVPLHRLGTPWDAARGVVFLASEQAAFITGASLNVNGGKLME